VKVFAQFAYPMAQGFSKVFKIFFFFFLGLRWHMGFTDNVSAVAQGYWYFFLQCEVSRWLAGSARSFCVVQLVGYEREW
jgi:hypothetical protein